MALAPATTGICVVVVPAVVLRSSVAFYEQMASFDDAGVSDRPKEDGP